MKFKADAESIAESEKHQNQQYSRHENDGSADEKNRSFMEELERKDKLLQKEAEKNSKLAHDLESEKRQSQEMEAELVKREQELENLKNELAGKQQMAQQLARCQLQLQEERDKPMPTPITNETALFDAESKMEKLKQCKSELAESNRQMELGQCEEEKKMKLGQCEEDKKMKLGQCEEEKKKALRAEAEENAQQLLQLRERNLELEQLLIKAQSEKRDLDQATALAADADEQPQGPIQASKAFTEVVGTPAQTATPSSSAAFTEEVGTPAQTATPSSSTAFTEVVGTPAHTTQAPEESTRAASEAAASNSTQATQPPSSAHKPEQPSPSSTHRPEQPAPSSTHTPEQPAPSSTHTPEQPASQLCFEFLVTIALLAPSLVVNVLFAGVIARRKLKDRRQHARIRQMLHHIEEPPQPRGAQVTERHEMSEFLWAYQPTANVEAAQEEGEAVQQQEEDAENPGMHTTKTTYFDASDNFSDVSL